MKKVKGLAKEHICFLHGHGRQCLEGRGRGVRGRGGQRRGKWGTPAIVSTLNTFH